MAMGIPVICNEKVGDTENIVNKYKSGICLNSFDDETFENAIEKINKIEFKKDDIRNGAIDYFDLKKGIDLYLEIYKKIVL